MGQGSMSDDNQPQLEIVGHAEDGFIIWYDGSPPTPLPDDLKHLQGKRPNAKPADGVCRSADEEE